jgi:hypothetical protein
VEKAASNPPTKKSSARGVLRAEGVGEGKLNSEKSRSSNVAVIAEDSQALTAEELYCGAAHGRSESKGERAEVEVEQWGLSSWASVARVSSSLRERSSCITGKRRPEADAEAIVLERRERESVCVCVG